MFKGFVLAVIAIVVVICALGYIGERFPAYFAPPNAPPADTGAGQPSLSERYGEELEEAFYAHFEGDSPIDLFHLIVLSYSSRRAVVRVAYRQTCALCAAPCQRVSDYKGDITFFRQAGQWLVYREDYWSVIHSCL